MKNILKYISLVVFGLCAVACSERREYESTYDWAHSTKIEEGLDKIVVEKLQPPESIFHYPLALRWVKTVNGVSTEGYSLQAWSKDVSASVIAELDQKYDWMSGTCFAGPFFNESGEPVRKIFKGKESDTDPNRNNLNRILADLKKSIVVERITIESTNFH